MKLKDFIKVTISEIAVGIHEAMDETKELIAVCPGHMNGERLIEKSYIEFDVAVTANETAQSGKSGGGELSARIEVLGNKIGGALKASGEEQRETRHEKVSRVCFKVPVYFNANYRNDKGFKKGPDDK